jgi:hypothetical protein
LDVINLPEDEGYATKDIFKPHPTKKGLWKLYVYLYIQNVFELILISLNFLASLSTVLSIGRVDDVIIHSSGEKTVPPPMEFIMLNSPE